MKKAFVLMLILIILIASPASANPFTAPAEPASSWSLLNGMELVGEDVFAEMLTEVKQNIINSIGADVGVGIMYSPAMYALVDSFSAEGINPHKAVYSIGDDSADLTAYFELLKAKGYLDEIPSSFTEEVANEIRKIQYAAGLPATGEITNAIAAGLLLDSAVPSNEETLSSLAAVSDKITDKCTQEMNAALACNSLILSPSPDETDSCAYAESAMISTYIQTHNFLPSFVVRYQLYLPVSAGLITKSDSEIGEDAVNIASNSSALLSVLFYYAQHDLMHDFTGYAVEYDELLKSNKE